ncbi:MAG: hypothetical protein IKP92_05970 [Lachnospiraceae bacterium]|nr:hypothetical protein [Lachnospiraceae bacterium]
MTAKVMHIVRFIRDKIWLYDLAFLLVWLFVSLILRINHLEFRPIVKWCVAIFFFLGVLIGLFQMIVAVKNKVFRVISYISSPFLFLLLAGIVLAGYLYVYMFSHSYIVKIKSKTYYADVGLFLRTVVNYHEYKGFMIQSTDHFYEDYGRGNNNPYSNYKEIWY